MYIFVKILYFLSYIGSISILTYACYVNRNIPHVINVSARYYMPGVLSRFEKSQLDLMKDQGYFYWVNNVRGEIVRIKITEEDFDYFLNYDMSFGKNIII